MDPFFIGSGSKESKPSIISDVLHHKSKPQVNGEANEAMVEALDAIKYYALKSSSILAAPIDGVRQISTLIYGKNFHEVTINVPPTFDVALQGSSCQLLMQQAEVEFQEARQYAAGNDVIVKVSMCMSQLDSVTESVLQLHNVLGQFADNQPLLECYILPNDKETGEPLSWPLFVNRFRGSKQENAQGTSLLFVRATAADKRRVAHSLYTILSGSQKSPKRQKSVAWVGLSGIGKSSASQLLLMEAVGCLGRGPDQIPIVLYRVGDNLLAIWLDESKGIEVQALRIGKGIEGVSDFCNNLYDIFDKPGLTLPVLILDLKDQEESGFLQWECFLPTLLSSSSRNAHILLKTLIKGGRLVSYVMQPWFREEVSMMHRMMKWSKSSPDIAFPSEEQLLTRFYHIGGVVRFLFGDQTSYRNYMRSVKEAATKSAVLLHEIADTSVYHLGTEIKFLLAPTITPGTECPPYAGEDVYFLTQDGAGNNVTTEASAYKYSFLSAFAALRLSHVIKMPGMIKQMEILGLTYQFHETLVLYGALLRRPVYEDSLNLPLDMMAEQWYWSYKAYARKRKSKLVPFVGGTEVKELLECMSKNRLIMRFGKQVLSIPANKLKDNIVYRSGVVNIYDFMTVRHVSSGPFAKTVFFWQMTTQSAKQLVISPGALEAVLKGLKMWQDEECADYNFVYILVRPEVHSANSEITLPIDDFDVYVKKPKQTPIKTGKTDYDTNNASSFLDRDHSTFSDPLPSADHNNASSATNDVISLILPSTDLDTITSMNISDSQSSGSSRKAAKREPTEWTWNEFVKQPAYKHLAGRLTRAYFAAFKDSVGKSVGNKE